MYLTRMRLDTTRRETMRALTMPNLFHGAIESAFSGPRQRRLWRLDTLGGERYLLLLSGEKPELSQAAEQFGPPGGGWETKEYSSLLRRVEPGSVWHFRLVANPTKSWPAKDQTGRGVVHAHTTVAFQEKWLLDRAEKAGFALPEDGFSVVHSQWLRFLKGGEGKRPVSLLAVAYEGTLTVTDEVRFRQTLVGGLGRGKAYGLGLLTVVRGGD